MQSENAPKIQMPVGAEDVIQRPGTSSNSARPRRPAQPRPRKRRNTARLLTLLSAGALSLLWLAGLAAFSYGTIGTGQINVNSFSPGIWAGLVAAALLPVAFIWVGAFIFLRLIEMQRAAGELARISRELIDPGTTAANDVAKLGATIRKELEGLNREVDGAVGRVRELETNLRQQTSLIEATAQRVDKKTAEMTLRLSEEREKVDHISRTLSNEGRIIKEAFDNQAHEIERAQKAALEVLKNAETSLNKQREDLSSAASSAAETTKSIATDIERETGKLESVSGNARSRAEAITARFDEQHKALTDAVAKQADQQTRLDAAMEQQHRLIGKMTDQTAQQITKMSEAVGEQAARMAEKVTKQIESFEASIAKQAGDMAARVSREVQGIEAMVAQSTANFEASVSHARDVAMQSGEGFEGQAAAMTAAAAAASAQLDDAIETVRLLTRQAREDLEAQVRGTDTLFQEQAEGARRLLKTQADELGRSLEASIDNLRTRMTELADEGAHSMSDRAGELDEALRRSEHRMRALYQRLDASIEGVTEGTETVGKRLAETADAFEARMAQFPAHARDAADAVKAQINAQIEQLAKLADTAASRAQTLTETIEKQKAEPVATPAPAPTPEAKQITPPAEEKPAQPRAETPSPAPEQKADPAPRTVPLPTPTRDDRLGLLDTSAPVDSTPAPHSPDLPGRDVYPQIWDGMEKPKDFGRTKLGRPRLGSFDDIARSLAGRLLPGGKPEPEPAYPRPAHAAPSSMGKDAATSTGAIRAEMEEDISSFRVIRREPGTPVAKDAPAKADAPKQEPAVSRPAPEPAKTPIPKFEERGWRDILTSIDKREAEQAAAINGRSGTGDDASFQRDALLIIEKLQAMSIDLDRALEDAPPAELLDRYMSGERNVFARRLATFTGPDMLEKIARLNREDSEFRGDVSRYIESFEDLLKAARGRDRENILLETYLTSQTGKVYMILATATGHLKQKDV